MADILDKWQQELIKYQADAQLQVRSIWGIGINDISKLVKQFPFRGFDIGRYPLLQRRVDLVLQDITRKVERTVTNGMKKAWSLSDRKNVQTLETVIGGRKMSTIARKKYFEPQLHARNEFIARTEGGLNLSDRIWQYVQGFRQEMEADMLTAIQTGMPAKEARKLMQRHLLHPEGQQNPGPGVYKSPLKNTFRLTRTEINMSYQMADFRRWEAQPFVVGIKVSLSNNHPEKDQCDVLAGNYPKNFLFRGWHPQCLCHAAAILITREEMDRYQEAIFEEASWDGKSVNTVSEPPPGFEKYLKDNRDSINNSKNTPYWVKDNPEYMSNLK